MTDLSFAGQTFFLHSSGALVWPDQELLIVADMHLEKSSWFARRGFFLPPYDSQATLSNVIKVLEQTGMRRVLLLGDCLHDEQGHKRLSRESLFLFHRLLSFDPIWIKGNHDGAFVPEGVVPHDYWTQNGIVFRHEAQAGETGEISGHFHPCAVLRHKGAVIRRNCFIEDGRKMILPAFGAYTGGLEVQHPAITQHFAGDFNVHLLSQDAVYSFRRTQLENKYL